MFSEVRPSEPEVAARFFYNVAMVNRKFLIALILGATVACIIGGIGIINKSEIKRQTLLQDVENFNRKISLLEDKLNRGEKDIERLEGELVKAKEEKLKLEEKLTRFESDLAILGDYLIKAREANRPVKKDNPSEKLKEIENPNKENKDSPQNKSSKEKENLERLLEIEKELKGEI